MSTIEVIGSLIQQRVLDTMESATESSNAFRPFTNTIRGKEKEMKYERVDQVLYFRLFLDQLHITAGTALSSFSLSFRIDVID